jgi:hypothetical protein
MSDLIRKVQELIDLDKKILPGDLSVDYKDLRTMLDVLGNFELGDKDTLHFILDYLCDDPNDNRDPEIEIAKGVLCRLIKAANLMEVD